MSSEDLGMTKNLTIGAFKMYWNNMPLTNAEGITLLDDVSFSLRQ